MYWSWKIGAQLAFCFPVALDPITSSCAQQLRTLDHSAYIGCLFADPRDQPALIALQAYNGELARIRESVSEPMLGEIRLTWWREALEGAEVGNVREHPVVKALAPHIQNGALGSDALLSMIDARQQDLYEEGPKDRRSVSDYAASTGGALYSLAIAASGGDVQAQARAGIVGAAATLVGIVRSVAFHAQMRRSHMPEDVLQDMGLQRDAVFQGQFTADLKMYLQEAGNEALESLTQGLRSDWSARHRRALAPLVFAARTAKALARNGFDPEKPTNSASLPGTILRTWWFVWTGRV
ncbi:MAG: squalene/phytoene synthase family protein [Pseudomonadota bacterium]